MSTCVPPHADLTASHPPGLCRRGFHPGAEPCAGGRILESPPHHLPAPAGKTERSEPRRRGIGDRHREDEALLGTRSVGDFARCEGEGEEAAPIARTSLYPVRARPARQAGAGIYLKRRL
jgi:hypothetical protein